jgi:hypothetical protein
VWYRYDNLLKQFIFCICIYSDSTFFSKSKGQVMCHGMCHVQFVWQIMWLVMWWVRCMSHDCWLIHHMHLSGKFSWCLGAKPWWLTAKDAISICRLSFLFVDQAFVNKCHVIPMFWIYKRTQMTSWVPILTSCGFWGLGEPLWLWCTILAATKSNVTYVSNAATHLSRSTTTTLVSWRWVDMNTNADVP